MTIQRQVAFWLAALVAIVLVLWVLRGVLLPFVAALVLAYLLDPVADRFEKLGIGRLGATILILVLFVLLFMLALVLIAPLLFSQLTAFLQTFPSYVVRLQRLVTEEGRPLIERLGGPEAVRELEASIGDVVSQGTVYLAALVRSLWLGGQALLSVFSLLVVTPVVAFYLLVDWDRMIATVDRWTPVRHRGTVRRLTREMDAALAGFIRGQATVCLILGAFYALGLTAIGLNFGILIGLAAGLLSFIPYVGSLTGLILAVGVAIVQFWPNWPWVAAALGIFAFGQFVEGNILYPKLVGASVGLHPVWLMFALFAFGSLFGFVGLLLAVPLAAALGVLTRFALQRYLNSPFYDAEGALGRGGEPDA